MNEITFIRTHAGLAPMGPEATEQIEKWKLGSVITGKFKQNRNPDFHRKYFALLNFAFEHWEPGEISSKYGTPEKSFDRFRKDLAILSGFYETTIRLNGTVQIEPKSISFANMGQEEFEELYSNTIDVILKRIMRDYTRADIDAVVEELILGFA